MHLGDDVADRLEGAGRVFIVGLLFLDLVALALHLFPLLPLPAERRVLFFFFLNHLLLH